MVPKKIRKIGREYVRPQTLRVGESTMMTLHNNEKKRHPEKLSPVVIMQPQGGKTSVIVVIIYLFICDCIRRKRTFQVVVFTGLSNCDLTDQTEDRLTNGIDENGNEIGAELDRLARQSGLARYVDIKHLKQGILIRNNTPVLKRLKLNHDGVDVRLIIGDEIHAGNVMQGNIETFFRNHGIKINEPLTNWTGRTINHFVGVSATPSAHVLKGTGFMSYDSATLFKPIYEPPPPQYTGIEKMFADGRLRQVEPFFGKTRFFERRLDEFLALCKKHGRGYLVVRAQGAARKKLLWYVQRHERLAYESFDCEAGNLAELNRQLGQRPEMPTVIIIRGSMRAGMTLPAKNYIRMWIEPRSVNADTQVQAGVGRACGYGRERDIYPIYCDLSAVKDWIKFYQALESQDPLTWVPSSRWSLDPKGRVRKAFDLEIAEVTTYGVAWDRDVFPNTRAERLRKGLPPVQRKQISSTRDQVKNDYAAWALNPGRDSESTIGIVIDGPTSAEAVKSYIAHHPEVDSGTVREWARRNRASYRQLLQEHPEWDTPEAQLRRRLTTEERRRCTALIFAKSSVVTVFESRTRDEWLKPGCAIRLEEDAALVSWG